MNLKEYVYESLLGLDLFASTLTGGKPGETLSGRAGKAARDGSRVGKFWQAVINGLAFNRNHCVEAIAGDEARARAVIADGA